jgi:hypothetical protein
MSRPILKTIGAVLTVAFWLSVGVAEPELIAWMHYGGVAVAYFDNGRFACCVRPDTLFRYPPWRDSRCAIVRQMLERSL